jgi:hypothetical protein
VASAGETVKRWAQHRPVATFVDEQLPAEYRLAAWQEGLLVDLTESAFRVALENRIKGPLLEVKLNLYRAVRRVTSRHSRLGEYGGRHS